MMTVPVLRLYGIDTDSMLGMDGRLYMIHMIVIVMMKNILSNKYKKLLKENFLYFDIMLFLISWSDLSEQHNKD